MLWSGGSSWPCSSSLLTGAPVSDALCGLERLAKPGRGGCVLALGGRPIPPPRPISAMNRQHSRESRILIVRLSALGDVVHALPMLDALRRARPDAEIGWLVEEKASSLLAGHPQIDRLWVAPRAELVALLRRGRWIAALGLLVAFLRELRAAGYELVIDVHSN